MMSKQLEYLKSFSCISGTMYQWVRVRTAGNEGQQKSLELQKCQLIKGGNFRSSYEVEESVTDCCYFLVLN